MKNYKLLPVITGLFVAILITSNILDAKIFHVIDFKFMALDALVLPAGMIIFPLGYVFGDLLTEVYGYSASRRVIWTGFASLLIFIIFSSIAISLPPAAGWELQKEFAAILGHMPRIMTGSIVAYFCGEFTNSYVLAKMKVIYKGSKMAHRFIVSTIFGQFVDTAVFALIAFAGIIPWNVLLSLFIAGWIFKVLWEIAALPIALPIVKWVKKIENEDFFDKKTDFNPFKL